MIENLTRWAPVNESTLQTLIDQFDRVVAAAAVHAPATVIGPVAEIARQVRLRRAYSGTAFLVGLAGGTGSGKSSLLNALADEEVSAVGAFRPTTAAALAWVPAVEASRLERLWEQVGLRETVFHHQPHNVALLDLPDVDSTDESHKRIVDELLPHLDLVLWVIDPEKYRDRVLHENYVRPLSGHQARFRFVLNQIDRLHDHEVEAIVRDLAVALREDGIDDPVIGAVAADPNVGPPIGIEQLWLEIESAIKGLDSGQQRTVAELERGLRLLEPLVTPVGLHERWDRARAEAARQFSKGREKDAWRTLRGFIQDLAAEAPEIDGTMDLTVIVGPVAGSAADISRRLDVTLGRHLRDSLRPRAATKALSNELTLMLSGREL
jgi:GTP-binding protein EngB required for normal cell division